MHVAATLEDAALAATALARGEAPRPAELALPADEIERLVAECGRALAPGQRFVRGVYAGGTLAWEAVGLLAARLRTWLPASTARAPIIASSISVTTTSRSGGRIR